MYVILHKNIKFLDFEDKEIHFEAGETVFLDPITSVAFSNGIHFDICEEEYLIEQ